MKKKLVIFDFDGVIIDTLKFSFSLNKKANPDLTWEEYQLMSHGNFYESFESENPTVVFTPHPNFFQEYKAGIHDFDTHTSIQDTIRNLSKDSYLSIVSSGHEEVITHFLEKEDLLPYFDDILGALFHKSKVVKLKGLLEKYQISSDNTVFITDTLGDILEGQEAGIRSIGVLWGLHDRATLQKGKPEIIIDDPAILEETIERMLNR